MDVLVSIEVYIQGVTRPVSISRSRCCTFCRHTKPKTRTRTTYSSHTYFTILTMPELTPAHHAQSAVSPLSLSLSSYTPLDYMF